MLCQQSQLRTNLITELQQSVQGPLTLRDLEPSESDPLILRAANSLVADHLRHMQYEYSLGVFMPESGLAQDKVCSSIFPYNLCVLDLPN
jgi:oral-facial-digital syndrome 1 protein